MYDAVVVGLGPAGSTVARSLAQAGLKVLGVDKETFPRYKSCGGCISTKIRRALDFDITPVIEDIVYGANFTYRAGRPMDILSDRPVGYNVMRASFDHFLVKKAVEAGAEVLEGVRIASIEDKGRSVEVRSSDGRTFTGSYVIGADGASGFIGRTYFGLDHKQSAVSITAEVPYDRSAHGSSGKLFIDFGGVPYGYGWIFPKKEFLSVGMAGDAYKVGGSIKGFFDYFIRNHKALKGLEVGKKAGWTVPIYYDGASPSVKGRVVLIGDSGHLVDPFLGEGIYYAIVTAKAASSAIIDSIRKGASLSSYQKWLEGSIIPEFRVAGKLADLVYNHPRLWYSIVEKDPGIMLRYYDVIRGEEPCGSFYEWVYGKIRSKPWKVIRRWIESRSLPA